MTRVNTLGQKDSMKKIDIVTAHEINDASILSRIEKRLGNEYEVRLFVDPKIKGGIQIKDHALNKQFDASVLSQLEKLHKTITR